MRRVLMSLREGDGWRNPAWTHNSLFSGQSRMERCSTQTMKMRWVLTSFRDWEWEGHYPKVPLRFTMGYSLAFPPELYGWRGNCCRSLCALSAPGLIYTPVHRPVKRRR